MGGLLNPPPGLDKDWGGWAPSPPPPHEGSILQVSEHAVDCIQSLPSVLVTDLYIWTRRKPWVVD